MKLSLGTVQFGLNYGVNNPKGKPTFSESIEILKRGFDQGIRIFDTAYAYGNAEEILKGFLECYKLEKEVKIISKLKPNSIDLNDNVEKQILNSVNETLLRIGVKKIDGYLLHTPAYIYDDEILDGLKKLKERGLVTNIGVSIYEMEDAIYAAKINTIDYIQLPFSIFDQRVLKTDFFKVAKDNGKTIFTRSAFLQGLLFMNDEELPKNLTHAKPYMKKFREIISKHDVSVAEAAMSFVLSNQYVDYLVFGVDNLIQLNENILIYDNILKRSNFGFMDEIKNAFYSIEESIIFPSLWSKTK